VVPVYNEAHCAESLLARLARLTDCEVVIADGGSCDGSAEKLRGTAPVPALHRLAADGGYRVVSGPRGRARQMNQGARAARAEVLLFLHADTTLGPQHALAVRHAVAQGADFGCFPVRIDSPDLRLRLASKLISLRSRLLTSATGDQAIFMRRSLFEQLGGYRELDLGEDLDLIKRARRRGRFLCLGCAVDTSARRWEQRGVTRTILTMWLLRLGVHAGVDPRKLRQFYEDIR
jgi:rSAM/selenodomain-associated transferase 2